jgi:hypothetical protein
MTLNRQRFVGLAAMIIALGALSLYPFETIVVPEWPIRR